MNMTTGRVFTLSARGYEAADRRLSTRVIFLRLVTRRPLVIRAYKHRLQALLICEN